MVEPKKSKLFQLLGLARRAGAVVTGTGAVRDTVRDGRALLVVTAEDASSVQLEKIRTTLNGRSIPRVTLGDRNTLGAAVGVAPVSALAVTDRSLADRLEAEFEEIGLGRSTDAVEA